MTCRFSASETTFRSFIQLNFGSYCGQCQKIGHPIIGQWKASPQVLCLGGYNLSAVPEQCLGSLELSGAYSDDNKCPITTASGAGAQRRGRDSDNHSDAKTPSGLPARRRRERLETA
jgi:hypothetical protein